jgi:hypothetical protein
MPDSLGLTARSIYGVANANDMGPVLNRQHKRAKRRIAIPNKPAKNSTAIIDVRLITSMKNPLSPTPS